MDSLLITASDVATVLSQVGFDVFMDKTIEALEAAFQEYASSAMLVKPRAGFVFGDGVLEWMPVSERDRVTIKTVGYSPRNPSLRGLPTIVSTICTFDANTGHLIAMADGNLLTAIRTGAASAIATRALASDASDSVGLVGCGCQAVTQLHALSRILDIRKVYVYDSDPASALSFPKRAAFLGLDIQVVDRDVLEAASDIICTATSVPVGHGPVLQDTQLRPHVHVNAVGSDLPGKIELPLSLLRRSLVCPDFLEQAMAEGECQQLQAGDIGPDIVELCANAEAYGKHRSRPTVFDSTGFAVEDHAAMNLLLGYVQELRLGSRVAMEHLPVNPKDPYDFVKPQAAESMARLHALGR